MKQMSDCRALLRPDRLRTLKRPFGWLPCRMLADGTIASMSPMERQLYLVLALAADRSGVSFYSDKRLLGILGATPADLAEAQAGLVARDLLAFDATTYQLLALPPQLRGRPSGQQAQHQMGPKAAPPPHARTPKREPPTPADPRQRSAMPESVRQTLREIFGSDCF
jgi:hypothetical protein